MADALISLGILFFFAIVGGIIATRFKLPAVLGLLLVGSLIGPNMFNLVTDVNMIEMMAEFGAILLLFVIGIEFDLSKIAKLGFKAVSVGLINNGIVFFIGFMVTIALGYDTVVGIFIGCILAFSSTVVIAKVLEQKDLFKRQEVPLLMAILIIEDLLAVLVITFFSGVAARTEGGLLILFENLVLSLLVLIIVYVIVMKLLKCSIDWLLKNSGEEILTFISLGLCAGFAYFAHMLSLSPTIGAFLAGSIIASLPNAKNFEHSISPYTFTFTSMFFISVGSMVDFQSIMDSMNLILVLIGTILLAKLVAITITTRIFASFKAEEAFFSSIAMFSVGEFAMLIAKESVRYSTTVDLISIASVIIFATAIIMALLVGESSSLYSYWERVEPRWISRKLDQMSIYIKSFFDEIDNENSSTRVFKHSFGKSFTYLMLLIFLFVSYRKILEYYVFMQDFIHSQAHLILIMMGITWTVAAIILVAKLHEHTIKAYKTLTIILSNLDSSRSLQKSNMILRRLSFSFMFLILSFLVPICIFLFMAPTWTALFGLIFMVLAMYEFGGASSLIDKVQNRTPQYQMQRAFNLSEYKLKIR